MYITSPVVCYWALSCCTLPSGCAPPRSCSRATPTSSRRAVAATGRSARCSPCLGGPRCRRRSRTPRRLACGVARRNSTTRLPTSPPSSGTGGPARRACCRRTREGPRRRRRCWRPVAQPDLIYNL
ncbi:hypothetical protein T492DRAFT_462691 [Pavlovales sp. CCMP2436]|nr:hypothetical protein T492DRAFT_462691 [Pavlovales sp. CCMP2436]